MTLHGTFGIIMVYFDWHKIINATRGDIDSILAIITRLAYGVAPAGSWDPLSRYMSQNFSGSSFLVNPYYLITEVSLGNEDPIHAAEYIAVASYRSIQDLLIYKLVGLPIRNVPFNISILKNNRLLKVEDDLILFKYEFDPMEEQEKLK